MLEANHISHILYFYHLRGLVAHLATSYLFLSQEEMLAAMGWLTLSGDQAQESQMGGEATNGVGAGAEDVANDGNDGSMLLNLLLTMKLEQRKRLMLRKLLRLYLKRTTMERNLKLLNGPTLSYSLFLPYFFILSILFDSEQFNVL